MRLKKTSPREKLLPLLFWWIRENLCVQPSRSYPSDAAAGLSTETSLYLSRWRTSRSQTESWISSPVVPCFQHRKKSKGLSRKNTRFKISHLIINIISALISNRVNDWSMPISSVKYFLVYVKDIVRFLACLDVQCPRYFLFLSVSCKSLILINIMISETTVPLLMTKVMLFARECDGSAKKNV